MRIDGTPADAVQSFQLPRCPKIVPLDVEVYAAQRKDQSNKGRRGGCNQYQSIYGSGGVDKELCKFNQFNKSPENCSIPYHIKSPCEDLINAVDITDTLS